ncbi:MAG: HNH endonuclease [Cyclobacteriaceae bacterium]|nr:HNH endonuclease [Cyclobacteriaceae bacterium]
MRPVDKGKSPNVYKNWKDARNDLAIRLGWYCSYCEMPVSNMLEVEHIVPRNHGGAPLSWENFLISCKYCNTIKSDNNTSRDGYLWPDRDNTDLAFNYSEKNIIEPEQENGFIEKAANATIKLLGLDRRPGGTNEPTDADTRWILRLQAWLIAKLSLENWKKLPDQNMADQIAKTAFGTGFYSVWKKVFENEPQVIDAFIKVFPNTYNEKDEHLKRKIRPGALI